MVKKVAIPCYFNGQKSSVDFYIGHPAPGNSPIANQAKWLASVRGGVVPDKINEAFADLQKMSEEQHIELESLCEYAFAQAAKSSEIAKNLVTEDGPAGEVEDQNNNNNATQGGNRVTYSEEIIASDNNNTNQYTRNDDNNLDQTFKTHDDDAPSAEPEDRRSIQASQPIVQNNIQPHETQKVSITEDADGLYD